MLGKLVGACPLTQACLNDPKVRRELNVRDDGTNDLMRDLQRANDLAVHSLKNKGYDGGVFAAEIERVPENNEPITKKHTTDRMNVLAKRTTTMGKYAVTGGCHLNSNDIFKAVELESRAAEIRKRDRDKKACVAYADLERSAKAGLARVDGNWAKLKAPELIDLLKWHGFSNQALGKKPQNYAAWLCICAEGNQMNPPEESRLAPWTEEDEKSFNDFKSAEIDIKDTALGRREALKRRELKAAIPTMSIEEREELKKEIAEAKSIDPLQRGLVI